MSYYVITPKHTSFTRVFEILTCHAGFGLILFLRFRFNPRYYYNIYINIYNTPEWWLEFRRRKKILKEYVIWKDQYFEEWYTAGHVKIVGYKPPYIGWLWWTKPFNWRR